VLDWRGIGGRYDYLESVWLLEELVRSWRNAEARTQLAAAALRQLPASCTNSSHIISNNFNFLACFVTRNPAFCVLFFFFFTFSRPTGSVSDPDPHGSAFKWSPGSGSRRVKKS
jgi:hypothetical protein